MQRRESFRLPLPTVKPFLCRVCRGTANEKALPVYDISVSGIGIQTSEPPGFEAMDRLADCWIDLHDSGMLHVTLEVRYVMASESRSGKPLHHMGCRFVDLPPPDEMLIQRFMARVETERRALSAG